MGIVLYIHNYLKSMVGNIINNSLVYCSCIIYINIHNFHINLLLNFYIIRKGNFNIDFLSFKCLVNKKYINLNWGLYMSSKWYDRKNIHYQCDLDNILQKQDIHYNTVNYKVIMDINILYNFN